MMKVYIPMFFDGYYPAWMEGCNAYRSRKGAEKYLREVVGNDVDIRDEEPDLGGYFIAETDLLP